MRKGDLADGSRARHEGGVRTGFVCKLRLQAPTHPFERCSADTTVCFVDATTFCDSLHCVPCAVSFGLLASTISRTHSLLQRQCKKPWMVASIFHEKETP